MRLFTAIELSVEARSHLAGVVDRLGGMGHVRWTRPGNLHITLKFIGEVGDDEAVALRQSLRGIRVPVMDLRCEGLIFFPPRGRARIVAAQVGGETAAVAEVFEAVEGICSAAGVAREGRVYQPHVTLGRSREGVGSVLQREMTAAAIGLWPGPAMQVSSVALVQSALSQSGAEYHVIERFA